MRADEAFTHLTTKSLDTRCSRHTKQQSNMDTENEVTVEQVVDALERLWKDGRFMRSKELHETGYYEYMPKEQAYACGRLNEFISYKKYMKSNH